MIIIKEEMKPNDKFTSATIFTICRDPLLNSSYLTNWSSIRFFQYLLRTSSRFKNISEITIGERSKMAAIILFNKFIHIVKTPTKLEVWIHHTTHTNNTLQFWTILCSFFPSKKFTYYAFNLSPNIGINRIN